MKAFVLALALCLVSGVGCRTATPGPGTPATQSPQLQVEWRVTQALGTLQKAAISSADVAMSLNASGVLDTEKTRLVISWARPTVVMTQQSLTAMQGTRPIAERLTAVGKIVAEAQKIPALQGKIPADLLTYLLTAQQALTTLGGETWK